MFRKTNKEPIKSSLIVRNNYSQRFVQIHVCKLLFNRNQNLTIYLLRGTYFRFFQSNMHILCIVLRFFNS